MQNIKEISKHYLKILAEEDKSKNSVFVSAGNTRTIFFWLADNFGKQIALSSYEVDEVINFLSNNGLVYWHMRSNRTIELTDKGYNWELHQSLFEDEPIIQHVTNKNTSIAGSPGAVIVLDSQNVEVNIDKNTEIYSVLKQFLDTINHDNSVDENTRLQFKEHLEEFDKDFKEKKKPNRWQWTSFFDSAKNIASVADIAVKIGQAFAIF